MRGREMEPADELFQEIVLDHSRNPRHFGRLAMPPAAHGFACNPACGDEVEIWVQITPDQRIENISFVGQGCAISQAAASLFTVTLQGKSCADVKILAKNYEQMLAGSDGEFALGRMQVFFEVRKFPARVACARVALKALRLALSLGESDD